MVLRFYPDESEPILSILVPAASSASTTSTNAFLVLASTVELASTVKTSSTAFAPQVSFNEILRLIRLGWVRLGYRIGWLG